MTPRTVLEAAPFAMAAALLVIAAVVGRAGSNPTSSAAAGLQDGRAPTVELATPPPPSNPSPGGPTEGPRASSSPYVTIRGGERAQHDRLRLALQRFGIAGLDLPDLVVAFSDDVAACDGHLGLFEPTFRPWRITLCSHLGFLYEHELAHAWEAAVLTDADRADFLRHQGLAAWSGRELERADRGVEVAAFVVQQVLTAPPSRSMSPTWRDRLDAYEVLTGRTAPRGRGPAAEGRDSAVDRRDASTAR